jgi:hypothetical protein
MPIRNDITVVSGAGYDTSGNGGRKLVILDSGTQYAAVKNGTTNFQIYASADNWGVSDLFATINAVPGDITLSTDGKSIFVVYANGITAVAFLTIDENGLVSNSVNIDTLQSNIGNVSVHVNEAKTEVHAAWASENSTYNMSFNIRYAKGKINNNGIVSWNPAVQVTKMNSGMIDVRNPTVITKDGSPYIIADSNALFTTTSYTVNRGTIVVFKEGLGLTTHTSASIDSSWSFNTIYDAFNSFTQSNPSAMFIPQSVNGLGNGRIWVAWGGKDGGESYQDNVRLSYSDDNGVNWSAMQKLTTGNQSGNSNWYPSITANTSNNIFVMYNKYTNGVNSEVVQLAYNGSTWTPTTVHSNGSSANYTHVSALFDLSVDLSKPLFIYRNNSKVGFYGTWTRTTINVTQGSIGQKTTRLNLLTYAISTDGSMSSIVEKVNGVTIGTRSAVSGQSLIVGLTQAQWDAIKYGRYKDITGGSNTLTITMGIKTFTYTFDKRPLTDITSITQAVADSQNVYIPAVKSKLANVIRSKGGTVNDTDSFETMTNVITGITAGKRWAKGDFATLAATYTDNYVSGLEFTPNLILVVSTAGTSAALSLCTSPAYTYQSSNMTGNILPGGFKFQKTTTTTAATWIAYE